MFGRKKQKKCDGCGSSSEEKFSFCPYCGGSFIDERDEEDFGLLGRTDFSEFQNPYAPQSFGLTDKIVSSMFNSLMKNMDKQFKHQFKEMDKDLSKAEIKSFPNGIRIKISSPPPQRPVQKIKEREIDENQIKKISTLPKEKAKTNVKRIGDKVVYELTTPGVTSPQDIFISKLESGYEIKAIGNKKVYVNSVPINLPLKRYSILKNKLQIEFLAEE